MAKRQKHEEHENHERWLVSYADFITLLFAFFVVLYATSQADVRKQEKFEESIKQNFSGGLFGFSMGGMYDENNDPKNNSVFKPPVDQFPQKGAGSEEVQDYVERKIDEKIPEQERKDTVAGVKHDAVGVRIQLAANKLFPSGTADLKRESLESLDAIAEVLKESKRKIIIEGHTDDLPIKTERYPSNWELSAARATKIVRYLIARHKIAPSRLTPVAYADQKPVVPNTSEENRARNRRIEIMIVTGDSPL